MAWSRRLYIRGALHDTFREPAYVQHSAGQELPKQPMRGSGAHADLGRDATPNRDEVVATRSRRLLPGANGGIGVAAHGIELGRFRSVLRDHAVSITLVATTAVAAAVRFATLDVQSFDHDEAVTALLVVHPSLASTLGSVVHLERNPPLYYVLAWTWSKEFGQGLDDLRLLSAILGTLTVPAAFLATRELASSRAGLIVAALVALNPFLAWYSQEARSYALLVLLLTVGVYMFARTRRNPTKGNLALWALASALALCSHYFAVFVIIPEAALLIAITRPHGRALLATAAVTAVGLALAPLAIVQQSGRPVDPFTSTVILDRGWQILIHFAGSVEPPILAGGVVGVFQVAVGVLEVTLALVAVAILRRMGDGKERRGACVALAIGVAAFAIPVVLAFGGFDFVNSRNMIGSLSPLLMAAGIAFGCARAGRVGLWATAATCLVFAAVLVAVSTTPRMQRPDWRGAARAIGPAAAGRVLVVPPLAEVPISYYLQAEQSRLKNKPVFVRRLDVLSRGLPPAPPHRGFRLVGRRPGVGGRFWLRRYQARRPKPFTDADVPSSQLIFGSSRRWHFVPPPRIVHRG